MGEPFVINSDPNKEYYPTNTNDKDQKRKEALDKFEELMNQDFDEFFEEEEK